MGRRSEDAAFGTNGRIAGDKITDVTIGRDKITDETTAEYWRKWRIENPFGEESALERADEIILEKFPEESKFEDGVAVRRIPSLMELYQKDILDVWTMIKIYPSSLFEGISFENKMSGLSKIIQAVKNLFRSRRPTSSTEDKFMLPFCIIYPPPSGGKATLTYTLEETSGINLEIKVFTVTVGGE